MNILIVWEGQGGTFQKSFLMIGSAMSQTQFAQKTRETADQTYCAGNSNSYYVIRGVVKKTVKKRSG